MTPNDLDAIRARVARAEEDADAMLCMAERDVPALCDEVAALRAERDRALAELKAVDARWQCSLAGNMAFVIRAAEAEERAEVDGGDGERLRRDAGREAAALLEARTARESLAVSLGQAVVRADREEKARRILEEHVELCDPWGKALARAQTALRGEA